jgi:hypothetical protein
MKKFFRLFFRLFKGVYFRAGVFLLLILSVLLFNGGQAYSYIQIDSSDIPRTILEGDELTITFNAQSIIGEIHYAILINGLKFSDTNQYVWSPDYNSSGEYNISMIAWDNESNATYSALVSVIDVPLEINFISPKDVIYPQSTINVEVSTSIPAHSCRCSLDGFVLSDISLSAHDSGVFAGYFSGQVTVNADGRHQLSVKCSNEWELAYSSTLFSVDTSSPTVNSLSYSVKEDYSVIISLTTSVPSICRYSVSDIPFVQMNNLFSGQYTLEHSADLGVFSDGNYRYYVRCANILNNSMNYSEDIDFSVYTRPSAAISMSDSSPLRAGTYKIYLATSRDVLSPSLSYVFNGESQLRPIYLTGSGNRWEGYMILEENTPNKVGAFRFSATDLNGVSGTTITQGELFLVDTIAPGGITSVEVLQDEIDAVLKWYYDNDDAVSFKIYRSESPGVDYVDYYDVVTASGSSSTEKYRDNDLDIGTSYYYRVSALDDAGNEGALSKEVYLEMLPYEIDEDDYIKYDGYYDGYSSGSSSKLHNGAPVQYDKILSKNLAAKVDEAILGINSILLDVKSQKEYINLITDTSKIRLISLLKLGDNIDSSISSINSVISSMNELKNHEMTASELDVKLSKLRMDAVKSEAMVLEDIDIVDQISFEQMVTESDIHDAVAIITGEINLSKDVFENYSLDNMRLQDSVSINAEAWIFRIKYLGKDDYDKYTLIKKTIHSSSPLKDVVLIERIPKELEKKASNIIFGVPSEKSLPVNIIKEDPVVRWNFDTVSDLDIYYQIKDLAEPANIKNTRSVILHKPDFKFSDTLNSLQTTIPSDNAQMITGMAFFKNIGLKDMPLMQWFILIGIGLIIALSVYYFKISADTPLVPERFFSSKTSATPSKTMSGRNVSMNSANSSANSSSNNKRISSANILRVDTKGVSRGVSRDVSRGISRKSGSDINSNFSRDFSSRVLGNNSKNIILESADLPQEHLIKLIEQSNSLANSLDYESSRSMYNDCIVKYQTIKFLSKETRAEIDRHFDHLYMKLSVFRKLHTARKHHLKADFAKRNMLIAETDQIINRLSKNLKDIGDSNRISEQEYMHYIIGLRNSLVV